MFANWYAEINFFCFATFPSVSVGGIWARYFSTQFSIFPIYLADPLHRIKIPTEILLKMKLFRPETATINNVEPFEKVLRALLIAQCPYKFSSFLDLRNGSSRFRLLAHDFRLFQSFLQDLHAFRPRKFAKLSELSWKI